MRGRKTPGRPTRRLPCTADRRAIAERGERAAPGGGKHRFHSRIPRPQAISPHATESGAPPLNMPRDRRPPAALPSKRARCQASIRTVPQIRSPRQAAPPGVRAGEHAGSSRPPFAAHRGHRSAEPPSNAAHGRALRRHPARSFAACREVSFQPAGSGDKPAAKRPGLSARRGAAGKSASAADSFICGGEVCAREMPPHRRKLRLAGAARESIIHGPAAKTAGPEITGRRASGARLPAFLRPEHPTNAHYIARK